MGFNVTKYENDYYGFWFHIATIKYYHLSSFGVVSNYIHNYLKKLLKYSSLSQLSICVRLDLKMGHTRELIPSLSVDIVVGI